MTEEPKEGKVILDVDGVLNGFSNTSFYFQFIGQSMFSLSKVLGKKKFLQEFPKLRKEGGANALFAFAHKICGDEKFNEFKQNLLENLNFDNIPYDPDMKKMLQRLANHGDICIRTDGLEEIAYGVCKRVLENKSDKEIKSELLNNTSTVKHINLNLNNNNKLSVILENFGHWAKYPIDSTEYSHKVNNTGKITISGIVDNNFKVKTDEESWKIFAEKYNIDLSKSVLLDDSKNNTKTASKLGMATISISKLDSLLQKSFIGGVYGYSLSDILGKHIARIMKNYNISYGNKVDVKTLFNSLLKMKRRPIIKVKAFAFLRKLKNIFRGKNKKDILLEKSKIDTTDKKLKDKTDKKRKVVLFDKNDGASIGEKIKTLIEKLQVNSNSEQKDNIANDKKNITIGKKETNSAIKQKFIQRNKNIAG